MSHSIGYLLLEEDGTETRVESTNTLVLEDLSETAQKTASELGLRDKTDTGSFKGAEGNIGKEFSGSGRGEVDGSAVLGGVLKTELIDPLLLEEFITTELEGTLEEVTGGGRTETGKESASTLVGNDLAETTDHTTVVCSRVKLDSGLDAVKSQYVSTQFKAIFQRTYFPARRAFTGQGPTREAIVTYTSTGVRAPWVTEQQTAPAKANLE